MDQTIRSILAHVEFSTPGDAATNPASDPHHAELPALFLRRWAANPLRTGSVVPSSPALCRRIVRHAWPAPGKAVLELGSGTGVVGRALRAAGLGADRLVMVEIDPALARHLRGEFAGFDVIQADARELPDLLPQRWRGRIGSVVCGIPLVLLPLAEQRRFIGAIEAVAPGHGFLHYSYCIASPLPAKKHGLTGARIAWTPLNIPPASLWRYRPARSA
jgi:phosphatidylethanolamine/phosphatidyl-N-methylethanolamine N-methyltransferase